MPGDAGEAAVDHRRDTGHRDAGLRDVRAQDQLALPRRSEREILVGRREIAVQRNDAKAAVSRELVARLRGAANLRGPGEKDEDVALGPGRGEAPHRRGDLLVEAAVVSAFQVL